MDCLVQHPQSSLWTGVVHHGLPPYHQRNYFSNFYFPRKPTFPSPFYQGKWHAFLLTKRWLFSHSSVKKNVVGTHWKRLNETLPMSTHNINFGWKIIWIPFYHRYWIKCCCIDSVWQTLFQSLVYISVWVVYNYYFFVYYSVTPLYSGNLNFSIYLYSYVLAFAYQLVSLTYFYYGHINSFYCLGGNFCHLLITFANRLDPDQGRQNVLPDLDSNHLTLWWYSWKIFLNNNFENKSTDDNNKHAYYPACKYWLLCTDYYLTKEDPSQHDRKIVDWNAKNQTKACK